MSKPLVKEIWLLVRFFMSVPNRRPSIYRHQVDIELGLQSSQSTPPSLEAVDREDDIAISATSANQAGEVEADHLPSSLQSPELQPTTQTTVEAETRLSPAMVLGGRIDGNELPRVHTENVQPALTDAERHEFHPAANEYLPSQPESGT